MQNYEGMAKLRVQTAPTAVGDCALMRAWWVPPTRLLFSSLILSYDLYIMDLLRFPPSSPLFPAEKNSVSIIEWLGYFLPSFAVYGGLNPGSGWVDLGFRMCELGLRRG
jgi:hypothetical protein